MCPGKKGKGYHSRATEAKSYAAEVLFIGSSSAIYHWASVITHRNKKKYRQMGADNKQKKKEKPKFFRIRT